MSRFFADKTWYFITVSTTKHFPFFLEPNDKQILTDQIRLSCQKLKISSFYFSVMNNHYHLLAYFDKGEIIPKLMNLIQGGSSFLLWRKLGNKDRPVWEDYHLYIPKNDNAFYGIRGYVIGNPLKHLEVKNFEELLDYPFSSFRKVVEEEDWETAVEGVSRTIRLPASCLHEMLRPVPRRQTAR